MLAPIVDIVIVIVIVIKINFISAFLAIFGNALSAQQQQKCSKLGVHTPTLMCSIARLAYTL